MKLYVRLPDGTFESSFAEDYSIDRAGNVWSYRLGDYLTVDRGRVWLSVQGKRARYAVKKLLEASLYVAQHSDVVVHKFTIEGTKLISMGGYSWRIPSNIDFVFNTNKVYYCWIREPWEDDNLHDKFMALISDKDLRHIPANKPTYNQFVTWASKYTDGLSTLQGAYDLYRDVSLYDVVPHSTVLLRDDARQLILNNDGSITLSVNGRITRRQPQMGRAVTPSTSSMLTHNRLIFEETAGLLTGPLKPLLVWAFRGQPQEGHELFNVTGNDHDFSVSNYIWVPSTHVATYTQMQKWLTRRWYMEVIGAGR